MAAHGRLDALVHCAGIASRATTSPTPTRRAGPGDGRARVLGPPPSRLAIPHLRAQQRGDVVLISSIVGSSRDPAPRRTRWRRPPLRCSRSPGHGEREHGVRVDTIAPGLVATDMGDRLSGRPAARTRPPTSTGRAVRPGLPARGHRRVVAFLLSDRGGYLTGQRLIVDGGETWGPWAPDPVHGGTLMSDLILRERHGEHVLVLTINRFERRTPSTSPRRSPSRRRSTSTTPIPTCTSPAHRGRWRVQRRSGPPGGSPRRARPAPRWRLRDHGGAPEKPLTAAIEGYALAGGSSWRCRCDLIVAAEGAPGPARGDLVDVGAGGGLSAAEADARNTSRWSWPYRSEPPAKYFHQVGVVNLTCPPGQVLETALALANQAARGPAAVAASAQVVCAPSTGPRRRHGSSSSPHRPDHRLAPPGLGPAASAEKRSPVWESR